MRTTWIVAPAMIVEATTAVLLVVFPAAEISAWLAGTGLGLIAVIWLSTALVQVPCHEILTNGFDPATHRRLVRTNWVRTGAWTMRSLIVITLAWSALR